MSYIQVQKGSGTGQKHSKYVYLAWNEWNSEKQQSVQRRFYVGRINDEGQIVVNKKFTGGQNVCVDEQDIRTHAKDKRSFEAWLRETAAGPACSGGIAKVDIAGDGWIAKHLALESGLTRILDEVFGQDDGGALAGLAAHQMITSHALYRAGAWLSQREVPATWKGSLVSESTVHSFITRIGNDTGRRELFLEKWAGTHKQCKAILHDITSVSSYSQSLDLAEWGHNRDDEKMPQVNLSLASTPDGTPLFYRVIPGSIPDVRTLSASLLIARDYGVENPCLSLDRGFYSQANLRDLLELQCGFLIGVPWSVKQANVLFKKHAARLTSPNRNFLHRGVPLRHISDKWMFENTEFTLHIYFDPGRHADISLRCEKTVLLLVAKADRENFKNMRTAKKWIVENAGVNASCLRAIRDANGTIKITSNPKQIALSTARSGYTLVLSHGRDKSEETAETVLSDYRSRDAVEKIFDSLKTEDGQHRLRTGSDSSVQGRFFLAFIALIMRAELEKRMRDANLHKSMTTAEVFDELAKAKTLVTRQGNRILLEVSKKQRQLLNALNLPELT